MAISETKVTRWRRLVYSDHHFLQYSVAAPAWTLKMICNHFLVVKVNCLSSVFNIMKSILLLRNVKNMTILEKKRLKVLTR